MNVSQLIVLLSAMPQDARVGLVIASEAMCAREVEEVYLDEGDVILEGDRAI